MATMRLNVGLVFRLCAALGGCAMARPAGGQTGIVRVAATPTSVQINVAGAGQQAKLVELRPHEDYDATRDWPALWEGLLTPQTLEIPREHEQRDRLYSRFLLIDAATKQPVGPPQWTTDLSALPARDAEIPWPKSIKGITCPVDLADIEALGVKYVDTNVVLAGVLDWRSESPKTAWEVDGEKIGINLGYVRGLDAQIKRMTDAGMNVTLIVLNSVPQQPEPDNPLIHPRTDLAKAPNHLGAFNCTDERGFRHYRAAIEFLADRYSRPDRKHGLVSGYIIGNEVQAHWQWHNLGRVSADELVADYARSLRIAWLACRRIHRGLRVYVSMEHHWASRVQQPDRSIRGDRLLEGINARVAAEGNFPWHLAFHPYPENLRNPRFWDDRSAWLGLDTAKITFKNIEVLPHVLRQKRFLFEGKPRRIILSEQGLHCPDGADGEAVQAAAYAAAYHKVRHIPEIDAFMLHRHVDYRGEGIRVGLWSCKQEGPNRCAPDRKRRIWDVFRLADTPDWQRAFAFAKPIVGIKSWDEMLPAKTLLPGPTPIPPDCLIADLIEKMHEAKVVNCLDWRRDWATAKSGRRYPTIFQHPPGKDGTIGNATFTIDLPKARPGHRIVLRFGTLLSSPKSANGVGFAVLVDGRRVWGAKQKSTRPQTRVIDLSRHAGRTIRLTLRVDSLGDASNDWANWLRPLILFEPL